VKEEERHWEDPDAMKGLFSDIRNMSISVILERMMVMTTMMMMMMMTKLINSTGMTLD
jgi:hypothetical protein